MKILYLTPAWFGFDKMIYDGCTEITGLPSFSYPLKYIIDEGHNVDMVIIYTGDLPKIRIESEWVSKIKIITHFKYSLNLPQKIISIMKYRNLIKQVLDKGNYDFVYVHGSSPSVANDIIRSFKIPFGQRLYGTFLWDKICRQGLFKTRIKHLVEFLSFTSRKNFLLATDDGSGADNVVKTLFPHANQPYDFHYWKNGVSRLCIENNYEQEFLNNRIPTSPFIFYCARFDAWKRQDRVIEILHSLKSRSIDIKVVFAGPFDTLGDEYYRSIIELSKKLNVFEDCIFLGSISKEDIYLYNKYAIASLSLYDVCNVTSVFHEMMASGALIIVRDDADVRQFISNGKNGFLIKDNSECVSLLIDILHSPAAYNQLRYEVVNTSKAMTLDWEDRSKQEIELIKNSVLHRQV